MYKKLIKYLYLSYFFLFCLNIHSNILLDENDRLQTPLPLPYNGITYTEDEINNFIDDTIKNNKRPILIFGVIGSEFDNFSDRKISSSSLSTPLSSLRHDMRLIRQFPICLFLISLSKSSLVFITFSP